MIRARYILSYGINLIGNIVVDLFIFSENRIYNFSIFLGFCQITFSRPIENLIFLIGSSDPKQFIDNDNVTLDSLV
jgi:hypothetical protein